MSGTLLYTHQCGGDGRCFSVGQGARAERESGSGSGRQWGVGKCKLLNSHTLHVCVCKFVFSVRHFREQQLLSTILAKSKDDLRKEAILM